MVRFGGDEDGRMSHTKTDTIFDASNVFINTNNAEMD